MKLILLGAAALTLAIAAPGRVNAAHTPAQPQSAKPAAKTKCADATWTTAKTNVCAGHGGVDAAWHAAAMPPRAVDSGSIAANLNSSNVPAAQPRKR